MSCEAEELLRRHACSCAVRYCYRLSRSILADKPRVTRFPVEFDPVEALPGAQAPAQSAQQDPMMGQVVEGLAAGTQDMTDADVAQQQQQQQPAPIFDAPHGPVAVDMEA